MTPLKRDPAHNDNLSNKLIDMLLSIEGKLESELSLEALSKEMHYSKYHFLRVFKEHTGMTTYEYIKKRRLFLAAKEILEGQRIIDVALIMGYDSSSAFSRAFKKTFGVPPQLLKLLASHNECGEGEMAMTSIFNKQIDRALSVDQLYGLLKDTMHENKIHYDGTKLDRVFEFSNCKYEGLKRYSGEAYFSHPLQIAILLADLEATEDLIYSALVLDLTHKTKTSEQEVLEAIGPNAYELLNSTSQSAILLKLVERLNNMRTIQSLPKERQLIKAKETLEVFLPLSSKYGNEKIKDELNDLSLKVYSQF